MVLRGTSSPLLLSLLFLLGGSSPAFLFLREVEAGHSTNKALSYNPGCESGTAGAVPSGWQYVSGTAPGIVCDDPTGALGFKPGCGARSFVASGPSALRHIETRSPSFVYFFRVVGAFRTTTGSTARITARGVNNLDGTDIKGEVTTGDLDTNGQWQWFELTIENILQAQYLELTVECTSTPNCGAAFDSFAWKGDYSSMVLLFLCAAACADVCAVFPTTKSSRPRLLALFQWLFWHPPACHVRNHSPRRVLRIPVVWHMQRILQLRSRLLRVCAHWAGQSSQPESG
jgi:hypothetical protein